jgi:hypothetical protein
MAFTNVETVRQHLSQVGAVRDRFTDVAVQLRAASPVALLHANLVRGSVRLKGKEIGAPRFQNVALTQQPASLSCRDLIPDSVVVASDSSLGKIYSENVDYLVDHAGGKIERINTGGIETSAEVAVWYYAYRLFAEGIDFAVNYEKGTIRSIAAGEIADGQTVFVDYQTQTGGLDDSAIGSAISEADDLLLKLIDPSHQDSGDQSLITAETYLALAILCRGKSAATLEAGGAGSAEIARGWRELADKFHDDGMQLAARFAGPRAGLATPTAVKGGCRR